MPARNLERTAAALTEKVNRQRGVLKTNPKSPEMLGRGKLLDQIFHQVFAGLMKDFDSRLETVDFQNAGSGPSPIVIQAARLRA